MVTFVGCAFILLLADVVSLVVSVDVESFANDTESFAVESFAVESFGSDFESFADVFDDSSLGCNNNKKMETFVIKPE